MNLLPLKGGRFGLLTVVERAPSTTLYARWRCRCDCGGEVEVDSVYLRRGDVKSCGCLGAYSARQREGRAAANGSAAKVRELTLDDHWRDAVRRAAEALAGMRVAWEEEQEFREAA